MSIVTHLMLIAAYIIFCLGVLVLGPIWFGLSEQSASLLAIFVFFSAWHLQLLMTSHFERKKIYAAIDSLNGKLSSRNSPKGNAAEASGQVVEELKILQSLLAQLEQRPHLEDESEAALDVEVTEFVEHAPPQKSTEIRKGPLSSSDIMSITQAALIENRVDLYMQPIVYLPSRNVVHYECFSRVRSKNGIVIDADRYITFVKDKGLAGTLDNLLFFRLIQVLRKLGPRHPAMKFFCNMSKESLNDPNFFPQFVDYLKSNRDFSSRIVLEITHEDYQQLTPEVLAQLQVLGRHGASISLDRVTSMEMDFFELEKNHVRFLKVDLNILLKKYALKDVHELVSVLRSRQIYLIISKVESEQDSYQANDCKVELAQGYLYGELRPSQEYFEDF